MTVDADPTRIGAARASMIRWAAYAGVLVLFIIAILSASLSGRPTFSLPRISAAPLPLPPAQPTATLAPPVAPESLDDSSWLLTVLALIVMLIVVAAVLAGVIWLIRVLMQAWRERRLRLRDGAATDAGFDTALVDEQAPDAPVMRRGIAAAREILAAHAEVGDAIIAAWVGLEQTAADSGVGRGVSETPAEFTLRLLLRRPGLDAPARELLSLYESVRFGAHTADERMRAQAAAALNTIDEGWR